ncbi:MAG: STAS/SEC14 domain-containing protein [Dehalococcoidia bacterium]
MIELIDLHSPKGVGFKISGKIERPDLDRVIEAIEAKRGQDEKLGVYVELESFGGISLDALVEDIKFGLPKFSRFGKKAVVSGSDWLEKLAEVSDKLLPGIEVRHFSPEEKEEAQDWVRE